MSGVGEKSRYQPSWIDRLNRLVEHLPFPAWLIYLLAGLALVVTLVGVQAWQGAYQDGFVPWHIFIALQPLFPVASIHYLDKFASGALSRSQRILSVRNLSYEAARFELTTMPTQLAQVAGSTGVIMFVLLFGVLQDLNSSSAALGLVATEISQITFSTYMLFSWYGFGVWIYHTIHQLRVIDRLYTMDVETDPFNPEPMYELASVTSRTALIILANSYGWFAANSASGTVDPNRVLSLLITNVFFFSLGVLIFIWPLWGAHRVLVKTKSEALAANGDHYRTAVRTLHKQVAEGEVAQVDGWEKAISALQMERNYLDDLATWPWAPGSLRFPGRLSPGSSVSCWGIRTRRNPAGLWMRCSR
ncbi:MAG: hypothetical protein ACLFWD_05270 [Anaerolineales bacterium]